MDDTPVRLNKHLALQLGVSRREADELIEQGRVLINSNAASLGARFQPGDEVTVNDKAVSASTDFVYLVLHKPTGYVCSRRAQDENPTIYELLPAQYHSLKPVGRLDKDSSGLILLSNDGDFAYQMTHPKFYKTKVYEVELDRPLEPLHHQMIVDNGIDLPDGKSTFTIEKIDNKKNAYMITMTEGRNRQIRRTFGALDYTVTNLRRIQFGHYSLDALQPGAYSAVQKQ